MVRLKGKQTAITISLVIIFLLLVVWSCTHKPSEEKLLHDFFDSTNDSVFITRNSINPYRIDTLDFSDIKDSTQNKFHIDLFTGRVGHIYGPYETGSTTYYVKIISADSGYKARVGNILISIKRGRKEALALAKKILDEINDGKSYDYLCKNYSDDHNNKADCDLGWFYNSLMVEEFAAEIVRHKTGEVFIVETSFGFHVVKSLGNPYRVKQLVRYVSFALKK